MGCSKSRNVVFICWNPRTSGSAYSNRAQPVPIRVATIDYKITIGSRRIRCRSFADPLRFIKLSVVRRNGIQATPHVPGGDGSPRFPVRGDLARFAARDRFATEIVDADRLDQPQVVEWKHVRTRQVEDQEHLR